MKHHGCATVSDKMQFLTAYSSLLYQDIHEQPGNLNLECAEVLVVLLIPENT